MEKSLHGHRLLWSLLLLLAFYFIGCLVLVPLERKAELQRYASNQQLYERMRGLYAFHHCEDPAFQTLSFCKGQAEFSKSLEAYFNEHGNSVEDKEQWTALGTVFFLTHLATTIGYGTSHPQTPGGRLATIVLALIGIPVMGYTLTQVARMNLTMCVVFLRKVFGMEIRSAAGYMRILWTLLLVLLLGGAFVYSCLEPWTYLESLYFCFVTLSTVGFGDFLPSSAISKAFSIVYIVFGLGVCASIIAVLTGLVAESHGGLDALLSKKQEWQRLDCCTSRSEDTRA
jgi:hypothetical protein